MLALLAQQITEVTSQIEFDAFTVTALVSLIIPVLTGFLTKLNAPTTLKQAITIVLAAVNTLIVDATVGDGGAIITKENGLLWAVSTAIAVFSYLGYYKPHEANAKLNPDKGLG